MLRKKNITSIIKWVVLFFTGGMLVFLTLLLILPALVESRMKNSLPQFSKNRSVEFEIEKIGFFNTFVSDIRIAEGATIDAVNIKYSLWPLARPQIKTISVSGLTLLAIMNEANQIQIIGLDLPDARGDQSGHDLDFLSYLPQKIALKNSKIILNVKDQDILIPFEILSRVRSEDERVAVDAAVFLFGEKIECSAQYSTGNGLENVNVHAQSFDSDSLNPLVLKVTNKVQLMGPVDFKLSSSSVQKKWNFDISQIALKNLAKSSDQIKIERIRSKILIDKDAVKASGGFGFQYTNLPGVSVKYSAGVDLAGNKPFFAQFYTDPINNLQIKNKTNVLKFVSPKATATIKGDMGSADASIEIGCKQVNLKNRQLVFDNGKLQWKIHADLDPGKKAVQMEGGFSIPRIRFKDQPAVFTRGKVVQTGAKTFRIDGVTGTKAIPQAKMHFNINADLNDSFQAGANLNIPQFELVHSDVKRWVPKALKAGLFDAHISAQGKIEWKNNSLKTDLVLGLKDGNFQLPDSNLIASGINTTIKFNDLVTPETIPGQIMTIDHIEVDTVKINEAQVKFSVEDGAFVLVENVRFGWCNGTVTTQAMRFPRPGGEYALSLYCDHLDLAQFLKQMKIFDVEGSGTMNGHIPVAYSEGVISFDNGFLFSSPGTGGKIKIENTEKITRGIPMTDPGFIQLDLTREALKDFDYTWANLSFNTFEDALYFNISLNGKPAKNLPFEPLEHGGFVRVDDSRPGSELEGLQLDVNLNLPFNEAMKFGNKLKSLFN